MQIILATDAKPAGAGAVRMAALLAADRGAQVEVVHALDPLPVYGPGAMGTISFKSDEHGDMRSRKARKEVAEALSKVDPGAADWPVHVDLGPAPVKIVRHAKERGADLILLGSGRHGRVERWLGTETALRVMQLSHVPVLAVTSDAGERRPRCVVAAVDFSAFSQDAFAAALQICAPGAELHLVHVIARPVIDDLYPVAPQWHSDFRDRVREQITEWAQGAGDVSGHTVEIHVLDGEAAHEVLKLAEQVDADLLVAGTHGASYFGRVLLGSVASTLLRGADCPVLVAPPREPAVEVTSASGSD